MTKEELIDILIEEASYPDNSNTIKMAVKKFFSQNVVIPKGENRHPYADVLHAWVEGIECEWRDTECSNIWNDYIIVQGIEFRIKPQEPVYEWQYALDNGYGKAVIDSRFYTDEEYEKFVEDKQKCVKLEWTKRVRQ